MIKKLIVALLIVLPTLLCAETIVEETGSSRLSETLGHLIVRQLNQPGFTFNLDHVMQGMRDEQSGKPSPMSEEEYEQRSVRFKNNVFCRLQRKISLLQTAHFRENISKNRDPCRRSETPISVLHEGNGEALTPIRSP